MYPYNKLIQDRLASSLDICQAKLKHRICIDMNNMFVVMTRYWVRKRLKLFIENIVTPQTAKVNIG